MIIRKSDLTAYAQELGMWTTLLEMAGKGDLSDGEGTDDIELEITKVQVPKKILIRR